MSIVVGVPAEIKDNENRVSVQPDGVAELVHHGHRVLVQAGAGAGSRFADEEYAAAGANVVATADEVFAGADLIVKVKEPIPAEYHRFRDGQQLFTYLHLAADRQLTEFLLEQRIDSIAYETVQTPDRRLPLLTPMSEVAGRMSVQAAAHALECPAGGAGILLGGVPGTPAAKVTIIGGGVSGTEAAKIAARHAGHRPGPRHQPEPGWPTCPTCSAAGWTWSSRTGPSPPPTSPSPTWSSAPSWCPARRRRSW